MYSSHLTYDRHHNSLLYPKTESTILVTRMLEWLELVRNIFDGENVFIEE